MELIPVLDLMAGRVVRARRGDRVNYRPIVSPLCTSAAPLDVATGLLALAPFRTLYVADLDAIAGGEGHVEAIAALRAAFPAVALWVDAGEVEEVAFERRRVRDLGVPVMGSESMDAAEPALAALASQGGMLSLDYDGAGARGPRAVHERPELWPGRIIVMTLARVGADEGPDFARLGAVLALAGGRRVYAAGGVRHAGDLDRLAELGVAGVLLASALHDGRLGARDIARFTN